MSLNGKCIPDSATEFALVSRLTRHLMRCGYRVRKEIPNMGQSVDVVATRNRWVTFIEVKRHDWRKAIEQCRAHEQVADFICIAIGSVSISSTLLAEVKKAGYGLIHCPSKKRVCKWIVRPRQNRRIWRPQREFLLRVLRRVNDDD